MAMIDSMAEEMEIRPTEVERQSNTGCCVGLCLDSESLLEADKPFTDAQSVSLASFEDVNISSDAHSRGSDGMGVALGSSLLNSSTGEIKLGDDANPVDLEPCSGTCHSENESGLREKIFNKNDTALAFKDHCTENYSVEARNDGELMSKYLSEMKPFTDNHEMGCIGAGDYEITSVADQLEKSQNSIAVKQLTEVEVKDGSNDDMQSEVSNPNHSPKNNTSSLTISSQTPDVCGSDHGPYGDITSARSLSTFVDDNLIDVEHTECKEETASVTRVVLEIPKNVRPTGIRKITFKFNKRKDDYDKNMYVPVEPLTDDRFYGDSCRNKMTLSSAEYLTSNDMDNLVWDDPDTVEMDSNKQVKEFYEPPSPFSCVSNRELKMSKKVFPDYYPRSVKKLLSTRILEGASVKYIAASGENEIPGIIKDSGFLCGCCNCNFSKVITPYEFEHHAGARTRHPNDHIYLENGKSISSIIHELRAAPLISVDEAIKAMAGSSINEQYFQVWRANLLNDKHVASLSSVHPTCPSSCNYPLMGRFNQQSYVELPAERKRLTKKQRHNLSGSSHGHKKATDGGNRKRDNDLHKLLFMPDGLPDGTSLAYYSKGKRILGGYKQGNGILCSCCNKEVSPSQFEAHAGWAAKRQPYRHIYTSSGLTLHDIALMLASGQSLASTGSDDMCAVCGGGGELIICNACPRAFHAACLDLQSSPGDDWQCSHCRDKLTSNGKESGESRPFVMRLNRVVTAPECEPGGCIICRSQDFSAADFDDRTVIICDQCEKEYHVGCLRKSGICDLKELPEDTWFCSEDCHKIFTTLRDMVYTGPEAIPDSVLATLNKKQASMGLITGYKNEVQWCILSGKSRSPEHLLMLTRAAAIFRERFDPIIAISGRDLIPVMVYGRNISGQEFSGMYCVVLIANSFVVSAALLRIFGREVAELPLVATTTHNQGKGYFQAIFSCIEGLLASLRVKHLVLPAASEAEPMWVNKLGFRKTSHEQMLKYTSVYQLTMFKGTSLLEKEVQS